ncbi:hypothetical protein F5Y04DRAFT_275956 [Hypomontagnella monticulosa]|nr:hypothetical protein F5Y04DRAFT_275956 [Hypomontagnella monticulosa]
MVSLDQLYLLPEAAQQAILNGPALTPPPGVTPNLDNPPNGNTLGVAVASLCLSVSTIVFTLAAYAKFCCVKKVHLEDFFVFSGYGLAIGVLYCTYKGSTTIGLFTHQWNVRVKDLSEPFYLVHVGSILYSVAIMLFKVAIILQWIRIFVPRGTRDSFYWACHILLWINVFLYLIIVILICASCQPFRKLWDPTVPGTCRVDRDIIDISTAVGNLISDIVIVLLPQRVIWKLHLEAKKKSGIAFIFFVGAFAIISAGFRLDACIRFYESVDKTYDVTAVALWGISELTCAMLVFCVPSIPKIFRESRLRIRFPTAIVSWLNLLPKSTNSKSGSTWPGKKLPLDSLYEPGHNSEPSVRRYGLAEAGDWPLERTNDRIFDHLNHSEAGIMRTTEIVSTEEGNGHLNADFPQHQSPWNPRCA